MATANQEGREAGSILLLPHESIICGSLHHQQDMDTTEYVLTNDGYIAKYHAHGFEGITNLFRLLHASEIRTVEVDHSPANDVIRYLGLVFLMGMGTLTFIHPFRFGVDKWWNGYGISENMECVMFCVPHNLAEIAIGVSLFMSMVMYMYSRTWRLSPGTEVSIGHDSGIIKLADRMNTFRYPSMYFLGGLFFFYAGGRSEGSNWMLNLWPILLLIPIGIVLYATKFSNLRIHSNYISFRPSEYPIVGMKAFGEKLLEMTGLSKETDGIQHTVPLSKKYAADLTEINEQLARHEEMLRGVGVKIKETLDSQSDWVGVMTLRASLEILLKYRVSEIKPERKNFQSGIKDYVNALKSMDESFSQEQYLLCEVIRTTGNATQHGGQNFMTKHDYLNTLQKFCTLVEWHFENPPILFKGSES